MSLKTRIISMLDWVVAIGCLIYGLYAAHYWVAGLSAVGMVLAWINPAKRLEAALQKAFIKPAGSRTIYAPLPDIEPEPSVTVADVTYLDKAVPLAREFLTVPVAPRRLLFF